MSIPNVSVIIPAYNAAVTLKETVDSLLAQTVPHWEAIIVDDGSEDETAAIAHQAADQDNRIRIVSQANQGVSAARNTGAQLAQGEWLLFLDADDQIAASYIAQMMAMAKVNPSLDAIYCGWVRVAPDGSWSDEKPVLAPADLTDVLARCCPFAIHACVVKQAAFRRANGFDTDFKTCEDWDLWQRIARQGARFERVSETLAYYHMCERSLSSDGSQFLIDGLRVLEQGHASDPRVSNPHPDYVDGLSANRLSSLQLSNLQFTWSPWPVGLVIGLGKDASHLLRLLEGNAPGLDPYWVATSLFESVPLPTCCPPTKWWQLWDSVSQSLRTFLDALEKASEAQGLTRRASTILERKIFENAVEAPLPMQIGQTYGVVLEVTQPIVNIIPPAGIERLYGFVMIEGRPLGTLELPICDGQVSQLVLKDCIAAQFYWQILGHFYEKVHYQQPLQTDVDVAGRSLHDQIGWTTFLQDLWDRSDWSQADFYDASRLDPAAETVQLETDELIIEVSQPLPNIEVSSTDLKVVLTVGGITFSQFVIPIENGRVSAQVLRVALTLEGGIELCRASVREAYLEQFAEATPIRQRLQTLAQRRRAITTMAQAAQSTLVSEAFEEMSPLLVIERRHQLLGSSGSRWASLPAEAADDIRAMALTMGELIAHSPASNLSIRRIIYAPDALSFARTEQPSVINLDYSDDAPIQTNFNNRDYFETLFSSQPNPWKYTAPYEQIKYEQTLSLLPKNNLQALELACAEGHFTAQLAPRVKSLVATDISQVAVERTAQRCNQFSHVHCQQLDMAADALPGKFQLIICSEVLYYIDGWEALQCVAQKIVDALEPGGYFLTAHAHLVVDEPNQPGYNWDHPFGAKGISDTFEQVKHLHLVKELWMPLYRVQLFQKSTRRSARHWLPWRKRSPIRIELPQPTPPPEAVASHVLWQGGEPYKMDAQPVTTEHLPILMYHRIAPEGAEALKQWRTSPEAFAEQLRYLQDAGYYSVSLETWGEAIAHKQPLPGRAVILTFDDGYLDFLTYAYPILQEYGFSATVFLVSEQVGKSNQWDTVYGEHVPLIDWSQIRQLQAQGIEFGSHTATHRPLTALSAAEIVREGGRSRTLITQELGFPVQTIAYPYGDTDPVIQHLIGACGYTIGVSCQPGHSCFKDSPLSLPRIEITGSDSLDEFVRKLSKS